MKRLSCIKPNTAALTTDTETSSAFSTFISVKHPTSFSCFTKLRTVFKGLKLCSSDGQRDPVINTNTRKQQETQNDPINLVQSGRMFESVWIQPAADITARHVAVRHQLICCVRKPWGTNGEGFAFFFGDPDSFLSCVYYVRTGWKQLLPGTSFSLFVPQLFVSHTNIFICPLKFHDCAQWKNIFFTQFHKSNCSFF